MKAYEQHLGKVLAAGEQFEHVMAVALNPLSNYKDGLVRCITSREGDVAVKGYVDRSALYKISGDLESFSIGERLIIKNEADIVQELESKDLDYLGLEDPDIWVDPSTNEVHVYFTMPFISKGTDEGLSRIHLGHAFGKNLDALTMTMPVLQASEKNTAKEVSVAPTNSQGLRYNIFESSIIKDETWYSTVRVATATDMGKPWEFGPTIFNPAEHTIAWVGGHASPGPLFSKSFIDIGAGKALGVVNGREANRRIEGKTVYGMFSVGLMIYDYEHGKIEWVSPEPLIQDTEAKTITFATQFVETKPGEGILYAHVDDSFVRAYTLHAEGLRKLLP